ncbi:MAG: ribosome maturation factor RimP [Chloroflexi bacterium]|nr:MAG: ribosome maturation factor RimP [Chloroflexota bacterium]TME17722.1 MAG: ribosome maturation factor RimP [Chloroflexota bacterium]TME19298.1 MAG: ribosome maturation factor RimP [Chloroflexota bacterium]
MPGWPIAEIEKLLAPTLKHMGYEIYAIEQLGPGGRTLRISIDKPAGRVSIDDCERVSEVSGPLLDQAGLVSGPYTLEVSSPGAERPLRNRHEYERFAGQKVNVRYRYGDTSEGVLEGVLARVDDDGIAVEAKGGRLVEIGWDDVRAARLTVSL